MYETGDSLIRGEAEKALVNFYNQPKALIMCKQLLDRGAHGYSQLFAASTLTKLVTKNSNIDAQQRMDIRAYILNYLAQDNKLVPFVTKALFQLLGRITKQGWFETIDDHYVFRDVIEQANTFIESGNIRHILTAVQLLSQIVEEMNMMVVDCNRPLSKQRKVASSFRDHTLFPMFKLATDLLRKTQTNSTTVNINDPDQHSMISQCLQLSHNCLNFDFMGTSSDESSDDLTTVQIPTLWRSVFVDGSCMKLMFDLYHSLPNSLSPMTLSCLVNIASVRRSLLCNSERVVFLDQLVLGIKHILDNPSDLSDTGNYHEFCRLLARLKTNYQLCELVKVKDYEQIIKLIASFTINSLQMWQFAPNSVHYLLSLWHRLISSVPYVKSSEPHYLDIYAPLVMKAYIVSRVDSITVIIRDRLDDPFDDLGLILNQLEQISVIGRCEYVKTCDLLRQLFDTSAQKYESIIQENVDHQEIAIQEGRLMWLVYIIGAVIGGRLSYNNTDDHDGLDGQLVCRVLQLVNLIDVKLVAGAAVPDTGIEKIDLAIISFMDSFRKIYISEQVTKSSNVYSQMSKLLGITDDTMLLRMFINKIITNLKYWGRSQRVIKKTLQLFADLSVGYSSVRKLVRLEEVQFILNNHTSDHFPFLNLSLHTGSTTPINNTVALSDLRCRTSFYTSLGRLLLVELGENEPIFAQFIIPITSAFQNLTHLLSQSGTQMFILEDSKKQLVGLARDLRGIVHAFNSKASYMMMFDWIYPTYTQILLQALEIGYNDPTVTTPVLKLFAELAQNRSQRLQFDSSSPNGILLFREISKVIVRYGTQLMSIGEIPSENVYAVKYKGASIIFSMLKAALSGNYVNFGVFKLYQDPALDDSLKTVVKIIMSIPMNDLLQHPKLSQKYYALLECLAQDHMDFISIIEPQVFLYILSTISEGLTALDTVVCTGCCSTLDNIITHIFKRIARIKKLPQNVQIEQDNLLNVMNLHQDLMQGMLTTVLNIIMFEDCRNQWSMSRPLLGLILLNENHYRKYTQDCISTLSEDKGQKVSDCFQALMSSIDCTLLSRNRDKFTQNISVFRRDVNDILKTPGMNASVMKSSSFYDMMN